MKLRRRSTGKVESLKQGASERKEEPYGHDEPGWEVWFVCTSVSAQPSWAASSSRAGMASTLVSPLASWAWSWARR
jgi:hypothetical protein